MNDFFSDFGTSDQILSIKNGFNTSTKCDNEIEVETETKHKHFLPPDSCKKRFTLNTE